MTGAPRATQVQLSPLPTPAMSDQHNKTQCVSTCSQEQLGEQGRQELCFTKSTLPLSLESFFFLIKSP